MIPTAASSHLFKMLGLAWTAVRKLGCDLKVVYVKRVLLRFVLKQNLFDCFLGDS